MKKGFTLVELSIVLVVIGLLIGGILVGQSLVRWTKLTSLQTQTTQLGILVSQFKLIYRAVPGEYLDAITTWPQICNSAKGACYCKSRTWNSSSLDGLTNDTYENEGAFAQLQAAGLLKMGRAQIYSDGTSPSNWTCFANGMLQYAGMPTKLEKLYGVWTSVGVGGYGYEGTSMVGLNFGAHSVPIATRSEAMGLDQKFDDGLPMTGSIKSIGTAAGGCSYDAGNSGIINGYNNRYQPENSVLNCYMQIYYPTYYNKN